MMSNWVVGVFAMSLLVLSEAAYGNVKQYPAYPANNGYKVCPAIGGYKSECRPAEDCSVWYDLVLVTPGACCKLNDGNPGICCPTLPPNGNGVLIQRKAIQETLKSTFKIDKATVEKAIQAGRAKQTCVVDTQSCLIENKVTIRPGSASSVQAFFSRTSPEVSKITTSAAPSFFAVTELVKQLQSDTVSSQQIATALSQISIKDTSLSDTCPANPTCSATTLGSPFRTLDGSCNNIVNSIWGRSGTQYLRLLQADYNDHVSAPRKAKNGNQLPSPRLVSISVVHDENSPSDANTLWTMQMGQFLDHDLVSTPSTPDDIICCTSDGKSLDSDKLDREKCLPISIPEDDPFYSSFGRTCMQFLRSDVAPRLDCKLGSREQMNANTHYLDLSVVYGSDDKTAEELRTKENGKLKISPLKNHHEKLLLPPGPEPLGRPCSLAREVSGVEPANDIKCFNAGDGRSSVTPSMATSQTVFLREHNRLAEGLAKVNPSWNDERLYQEARRILIAQAQHITYNEWLPVIIGRNKMQELGLLPLQSGFSQSYDANLNPAILNEFVTAAFRFGHSQVQGSYSLFNQQRQKVGTDKILRQHFFKSQEVYTPGNVDKFLISLSTTPVQNVDNSFTVELTNHLFEDHPAQRFGLDLVSLNIQRGRDHGLPGYNSHRELCGLKRASDFDDLCETIPSVIVNRFKMLYESVDDIDLFIGGISERVAEGALVGPTFQCIIGQQFLRLKRGDRYFYDLGGQPGSFTKDQLEEIRKTSLARLVCDNSSVEKLQPLIFKSVSSTNPIVDCKSSSIPSMSLHPWK